MKYIARAIDTMLYSPGRLTHSTTMKMNGRGVKRVWNRVVVVEVGVEVECLCVGDCMVASVVCWCWFFFRFTLWVLTLTLQSVQSVTIYP